MMTVIKLEGEGLVLCPQVDAASHHDTIEQPRADLLEASELLFGIASEADIAERLHCEVYVTTLEGTIGRVSSSGRRPPRAWSTDTLIVGERTAPCESETAVLPSPNWRS